MFTYTDSRKNNSLEFGLHFSFDRNSSVVSTAEAPPLLSSCNFHPFIFSNHLILLRVVVDPQPIPGILGLVGMHTHTHIHKWGSLALANNPGDIFWEVGRTGHRTSMWAVTGALNITRDP